MKKSVSGALVLALVSLTGGFITQVNANTIYTLSPGTTITASGSSYPTGGTTLTTTTSPFNAGVLIGTLVSTVSHGDTSNPFGLSALTFTYQLSISGGSPDSSSEMTVSSFTNFNTEASYNTNSLDSLVVPSNFSRSSGTGDVVRFIWLLNPILPGQSGAEVVVQTSATSYHPTMAGIIDGLTINVASLAPLPVPEPASAGLMLLGTALFLTLRRQRSDRR